MIHDYTTGVSHGLTVAAYALGLLTPLPIAVAVFCAFWAVVERVERRRWAWNHARRTRRQATYVPPTES